VGGHAGNARALRHVSDHDGARADERTGADPHSLDHDRADADVGAFSNGREPGQTDTRRHVRVRPDPAIVLDDRAGVDDRPIPDLRACIHDCRREDLNPAAQRRPGRDDG
jgi:hypothetical protein